MRELKVDKSYFVSYFYANSSWCQLPVFSRGQSSLPGTMWDTILKGKCMLCFQADDKNVENSFCIY